VINRLRRYWQGTTIGRSASVLSRRDQRRIGAVVVIQVAMGLLDLLGVAMIGILGALAVTGVQSKNPGNRVQAALEYLNLSELSFQNQAAILGLLATFILVARTLFSIFFTKRTLLFLSRRGAVISAHLISKLLSQSLLVIQSRTTQETLYALTAGVSTITVGILGTSVSLISDFALLSVMACGLFFVDPTLALCTFVVFALIGLLLYRILNSKAGHLGSLDSQLNIKGNEKIVEVLNSYRESVVRNRRHYYAREVSKLRLELSEIQAELAFMPYVSKYVIETSVVLGALLISGFQFLTQDATHAVATLSVFLAAGSRIAPAILRVQQGAISIRGSLGSAEPTLELISSLRNVEVSLEPSNEAILTHHDFNPVVKLTNVSLKYPNQENSAIKDINLSIAAGSTIAVVGSSGAGKTTLIDVLLGVLSPSAGEITISGLNPMDAILKWPGAISYVPQDVEIVNGTIRENIALGFPPDLASDEIILRALRLSNLEDFITHLPDGLDTQVGERGTKISGGQRQRLGIARALFTNPKLLVLDEATSALDGETEANVSNEIMNLHGDVTVIFIAHRLSTVRNADIVIYMDKGRIVSTGTFLEVRNQVPDFDRQAKLMGL
jgi:ABC-type multidrug transport system fused ATPase/permease subunit